MNTINRIFRNEPDYILSIVRPDPGWTSHDLEDKPQIGEVVSQGLVASFEEAFDDLLRCNQLAQERGYDFWAVIQSAGTDI